eukprot:m.29201 g.29201  ORF g.29201 m.29201 type:complete len:98 (+) comp12088_c0_seq1:229-522(+)
MPRKGYSALSDDGDDARPLIATAPPSQVVELWRLAWPACLRNILNCGTRTHTHRQPTSTTLTTVTTHRPHDMTWRASSYHHVPSPGVTGSGVVVALH